MCGNFSMHTKKINLREEFPVALKKSEIVSSAKHRSGSTFFQDWWFPRTSREDQ
jgi:hypothetical protein